MNWCSYSQLQHCKVGDGATAAPWFYNLYRFSTPIIEKKEKINDAF